MEGVINSLICEDFYSAFKYLIKSLEKSGVIEGAVFIDRNRNSEILAGDGRIKGRRFEDLEGISKSSIEEAEREGMDIFEDKLYVSPFYINGNFAGILYLDRISERRRFSEGERALIKIARDILERHIRNLFFDDLTSKEFDGWIGRSDFSLRIRKEIKELSSISPILLLGETGVGKNLLAELIHKVSGRKGNFVVVSLPFSLMRSQRFQ